MPTRNDFRVGQEVIFGCMNGEKTKGIITKLNPKKAKVQTLESRGRGGRTAAGTTWSVPYSLMLMTGPDADTQKLKAIALAKVMKILSPAELKALGL